MKKKLLRFVVAVLFLLPVCTYATVLTFDDIGTTTSVPIPDGYGGFNWSKSFSDGVFYYINTSLAYHHPGGSGLFNGVVSGDCVALPTPYMAEGKGWLNSATPFTLNGAYFTAVWRDGLNIQVDGYLNDILTYSTTIVVDTTGPTWGAFNYANIDELRFSASGGTQHEGYQHDNTEFVMDNFTYIPEPISIFFFAFGGVILQRIKR
ncbi:MAG: hypothetical protein WC770_09250 [Phycisphaerae bacterium]|jgi:hypothetical protein